MACTTPPTQMAPIMVSSSYPGDCDNLVISWDLAQSCSQILDTEFQCAAADGTQTNLDSSIAINNNSMKVEASYFMSAPFSLKIGNAVECRARAKNANDWGDWSQVSSRYPLSDCTSKNPDGSPTSGPTDSRQCKASCKATGCGGACNRNHQSGTFWSKLTKKACCKMGTCSGCKPKDMDDQQHRHNYCHVHAEDKFRTRKQIVWTDKKIKRQ